MQLACPDCGSRFRVPQNALGDSGRKVRCAKCKFEWFAEPNDLIIDPMDVDDAHHLHEPPVEEDIHEEDETAAAPVVEPVIEQFVPPREDLQALLAAGIEEKPQFDFANRPKKTRAAVQQKQEKPVTDLGRYAIWVWIANGATFTLLMFMCFLAFRDTVMVSIPALKSMYNSVGYADTSGLKLTDLALTEMQNGSKIKYGLSGKIVNTSDVTISLPVLSISLVDKDGVSVRQWSFEQPGQLKPGQEIPFVRDALESRAGPRNNALVVEIGSPTELSLRQ
ncbi:MAG: zinc-ribbon domain-containing protein [Rickettsiales bacterium]